MDWQIQILHLEKSYRQATQKMSIALFATFHIVGKRNWMEFCSSGVDLDIFLTSRVMEWNLGGIWLFHNFLTTNKRGGTSKPFDLGDDMREPDRGPVGTGDRWGSKYSTLTHDCSFFCWTVSPCFLGWRVHILQKKRLGSRCRLFGLQHIYTHTAINMNMNIDIEL